MYVSSLVWVPTGPASRSYCVSVLKSVRETLALVTVNWGLMEELSSGQLDIQDNKYIFEIIKYRGFVQDKSLMKECL